MRVYFRMYALWLFFSIGLVACSSSRGGKEKDGGRVVTSKSFQRPEMPTIYSNPEDQATYLITRYWDHFDFADTSLIHRPEVTEQAFVEFLQLFPCTSPVDLAKGITGMLDQALSADSLVFAHFTGLYDRYLYDPNSPMLNEEFYIPVLEYIVKSPKIGEIDKVRPAYRLEMALKNRVGDMATDFVYTLASGKKARLSGIRSDYTILFFNNPDCHACREIRARMDASVLMNRLLSGDQGGAKKVVFLSVFPDAELDVWREHLLEQPKEWVNAYDDGQVISKGRLYDLRAIPTFYLLDKDKRVVLKDAPLGMIINYFNQFIGVTE